MYFKLKKLSVTVLLIVLFSTCEKTTDPTEPDTADTTPPTVAVTTPIQGQTVYEIVTISCVATDNDSVEKVELWVSGVSTGMIDRDEPYFFEWNTISYDDGLYTISVRAYDINGNSADSDPINILVDNSLASPPTRSTLNSIYVLDNHSFIISWTKNHDDDFYSYSLFHDESDPYNEGDNDYQDDEIVIYETFQSIDTNFVVENVWPGETRYYWVKTTDRAGLYSYSSTRYARALVADQIFFDDFSTGVDAWRPSEPEGYTITSANETLQISGENDGYQHRAYLYVGDWTGDFLGNENKVIPPVYFQGLVTMVSEGTAGSRIYGLGLMSSAGRYYYLISRSGYVKFSFYSTETNEWTALIDWFLPSEQVSFQDGLLLFYSGQKFELYLNENFIGSFDELDLDFYGVFLYQQSDMVIRFDNVGVAGYYPTSSSYKPDLFNQRYMTEPELKY